MARQWILSFKKLLYLRGFIESSHPKQMPSWFLWKDPIERQAQKIIIADLKDSLNKIEEKSDSE